MIRLLLIVLVIILVFNRIFKFLMRLGGSTQGSTAQGSSQSFNRNQGAPRRPADGNVSIDFVPEKKKRTKRGSSSNLSGDYVEYEELD